MAWLRQTQVCARRRDQRGAVAVEAALITPLLLVLVFAIIEFGFAYKDWQGVTSAVRAGARMASAEPRVATFAQDAANQVANEGAALNMANVTSLWVYKSGVNGYPVGQSSFASCPSTTCVQFGWNSSTKAFAVASGSWASTSQNACQGDAAHDSVGVYMSVKNTSVTGMFLKNTQLTSRTVMNLEPIPLTTGCK